MTTTIITLPKTKTCAVCKQTKPSAEFKRRLTLAQSRAMLRNPNITTRYTADSKRCKACQQLLKRTKPLTAKDIRTKVTSGDMPKILGEMKLQQLRESLPKMRSKIMKEHWHNIKRTLPYKTLKLKLADQVNRYGNRHFASKHLQDATQEQNSWNYDEAKRIKKDLLEQARNGVEIPSTIQIATLIKPKGEAQ
jgi:hypothetical protein